MKFRSTAASPRVSLAPNVLLLARLGRRFSRQDIEEVAKHRTRYFFGLEDNPTASAPWNTYPHPVSLLGAFGRAAEDLGLVRAVDSEHAVYRARLAKKDQVFETFDELGPPPKGTASASRMNPAGISYLYLAKERGTAVGEVASRPPYQIAIGTFQLKRNLRVLDLTALQGPPLLSCKQLISLDLHRNQTVHYCYRYHFEFPDYPEVTAKFRRRIFVD